MNETELAEKLAELKNTVKGLSLEVEGWRIHVDSTGGFVLDTLRDVLKALNTLQDTIK